MKYKKIIVVLTALALGLAINYLTVTKSWAFFSFLNLNNTTASIGSATKGNSIQVALLLDTSGSMEGLIEQAKSQLWKILNELARTEKDGKTPDLEIALYEYGNPSRSSRKRQIRKLVEFTTDMDMISEKLFALTTDGGEEYCGQVIQVSMDELEWRKQDSDMRMIYIAGNEPFSQGPVSYKVSCGNARERDIVVNTIFCGDYQEGINTGWKDGADIGQGVYMAINQNRETVYIETPYDKEINKLNIELNNTYIPYGKKGKEKKANQVMQDSNASNYSKANAADRATFKSSKNYKAESWDLVDAYEKDKNVLKEAKLATKELQNLSIEELEANIQAAAAKRASIQNQVRELDQKRRKHIEENSKKNAEEDDLQNSIFESIKKQAKRKGYEVKK